MTTTTTHTATVTGFEQGFSNSALRLPYVLARLSCGHVAGVTLQPTRGTCMECGRVDVALSTARTTRCECGGISFLITWHANAHNPADYVTQIGDVVDCDACSREAAQLQWLRDLPREVVAHARYRETFGSPSYHFYRRDPSSPSGVRLIGSVAATPAVERVLAEKRIAPLSPTEGLHCSGARW